MKKVSKMGEARRVVNPLRAYYGKAYNEGASRFTDGGGFAGPGHWENAERWRKSADGIRRVSQEYDFAGGRVIEAGCGPGVLVDAMRAIGLNACGFDLGEDISSQWCVVGDILAPPFFPYGYPSNRLVVALDVIEHVPYGQVYEAIANLCDLAPWIILTVPTAPTFAGEVKIRKGIWHHYTVLTVDHWIKAFEHEDAEVVAHGEELRHFGHPFDHGDDNYPFLLEALRYGGGP